MLIACPLCRTRHPQGATLCQVCGHDLGAMHLVVCPVCGALNAAESERCRRCSTALRELAPAPLPVDTPAPPIDTPPPAPLLESAGTAPDQAVAAPDYPALNEPVREEVVAPPAPLPTIAPVVEPPPLTSEELLPTQGAAMPLDPLVGLTAPLGLARAMAQPHRAALLPPEEPGDAERYDAGLLGQIAAEPAHLQALALSAGAHRLPQEPRARMHPVWRLTLYLLLLGAALLPLFLPNLDSAWVQPRAVVMALADAVETLPEGAQVLLVWDYDAGYGGELDPLARALLSHLHTRRAAVAVIAMSPASLGQAQRVIAAELGEQAAGPRLLGYIPSGEAGWRLLADGPAALTSLAGADAAASPTPWGDYALVVLLADSAAAARGWVEQAGVYGAPAPFVVVTARSEPVLLPFAQSEQLRGVLGAAWAAPEYEIASRARPDTVATASGLAGLAIVILIVAVAAMLSGIGRSSRGGRS